MAFFKARFVPLLTLIAVTGLCSSKKEYLIKPAGSQSVSHEKRVSVVKYSPNGDFVVSGGYDGNLMIWNGKTGEHIKTIQGDYEKIFDLIILKDNNTVFTANYAGYIYRWDIQKGKKVRGRRLFSDFASSLVLLPGNILAVAGWNGELVLVSPDDFSLVKTCVSLDTHIKDIILYKKEKIIAATDSGEIAFMKLDQCEEKWARKEKIHSGPVNQLAIDALHDRIITVSDDRSVLSLEASSLKIKQKMPKPHGTEAVYAVAVSPTKKMFATVGGDYRLILWDLDGYDQIHQIGAHTDKILTVDFHPTKRYMATSGFDRVVKVWQIEAVQF